MDLTPSTPAARVIDEVVPIGQGVHNRDTLMNNQGIHRALYAEDENNLNRQYGVGDGTFDEDGMEATVYVEGQRASPLWLDATIGVLGTLIAYMILRRFL